MNHFLSMIYGSNYLSERDNVTNTRSMDLFLREGHTMIWLWQIFSKSVLLQITRHMKTIKPFFSRIVCCFDKGNSFWT